MSGTPVEGVVACVAPELGDLCGAVRVAGAAD
jgi:hypothetical protein